MADTTHGQPDLDLGALTDQCVMCGLCLPHCPTYRLDRHEAESPRGRIALARQIAGKRLEVSEAALAHLDHCLGCLACQPVCPSKVRYDEILTATRAMLTPLRTKQGRLRRWLHDPAMLVRFARIGTTLRAERWLPRLAGLLPRHGLARRLAREMPARPVPLRAIKSGTAPKPDRGRVTLFPGCAANVLDQDTLAGAQILLEALGHVVVVPKRPVCCGALALHGGDRAAAADQAESTRSALEDCASPIVLVSASGCLGSLRKGCSGLAVTDIVDFLARDERIDTLRFRPLDQRATLHLPCTQLNVGSGAAPLRALLARIGGLELLALPDQPRCCGAAGSYFIEQPERADRLRTERLDQVAAQSPDLLLTTNIGCRIFLGNGLRQRKHGLPVLHPLALLARQLDTSSP